jgi:hypothetical protein
VISDILLSLERSVCFVTLIPVIHEVTQRKLLIHHLVPHMCI